MVLKIAYWTTTIIAAAMLLMAVTYLTGSAQIVAAINHLGYPQHLRVVLGIAKPAAGVVLLVPGLRVLKEWAYAGVSFAWSMAFLAHWLAGDGAMAFFPLVLLALLIVSYLTRPASRRLAPSPATSFRATVTATAAVAAPVSGGGGVDVVVDDGAGGTRRRPLPPSDQMGGHERAPTLQAKGGYAPLGLPRPHLRRGAPRHRRGI